MNIDWERLSTVEMASGIEVYYLAKLFRKNKFLHAKILKHALDEYRHSSIFYKYHKKFSKKKTNSSAQGLIAWAGLGNSPIDREEKNIFKFCTYVYIGEYRAIEFNDQATNLIKNKTIISDIKSIEEDELTHAAGVMKFLKKYPFYKYGYYLIIFKLRYFLQRYTNFKLYNKLQNKSGNFLAKFFFKIFPSSLFELEDNFKSLDEALLNAKRN